MRKEVPHRRECVPAFIRWEIVFCFHARRANIAVSETEFRSAPIAVVVKQMIRGVVCRQHANNCCGGIAAVPPHRCAAASSMGSCTGTQLTRLPLFVCIDCITSSSSGVVFELITLPAAAAAAMCREILFVK